MPVGARPKEGGGVMDPEVLKRFWAKVTPALDDSGCLLWTGCSGGQGYGWLRIGGRSYPSHRLSFEHYVGRIQDGMVLDHLCRNRLCINWLHLEPVNRGENVMRGEGFAPENAAKTQCPQGHPYDEANTYVNPHTGWRSCRICTRERNRERLLANRERYGARRRELYAQRKAS